MMISKEDVPGLVEFVDIVVVIVIVITVVGVVVFLLLLGFEQPLK